MNRDVDELDLARWVTQAPAHERGFREAVHVVLMAICTSPELSTRLVMKGGLLMALRYTSPRFTRDIDFSTPEMFSEGDDRQVAARLAEQLILASERLDYDTACLLQRCNIQPKRAERTFPSLALSIGYARRSDRGAMRRLQMGRSTSIVEIDYSYNEAVLDTEVVRLGDGHTLQVYTLDNLIAEKLRSLLQQPVRGRTRRQDVYDIHLLLEKCAPFDEHERRRILEMLLQSCAARGILADRSSMSAAPVRALALKDYATLADDVEGTLPAFTQAFANVERFYTQLPWPHA